MTTQTQRQQAHAAFTLLEILVVTAILGVVGSVILSAFATGIRVWECAQRANGPSENAELALARIERDLMNARPFYAVDFLGKSDRILFPGSVAWVDREGGAHRTIGRIAYSYEPARNALVRRAWAYPCRDPDATAPEEVLANVTAGTFSYLVKPREKGERPEWKGTWDANGDFPLGVRIEVVLESGTNTIRFIRTIRFRTEF